MNNYSLFIKYSLLSLLVWIKSYLSPYSYNFFYVLPPFVQYFLNIQESLFFAIGEEFLHLG